MKKSLSVFLSLGMIATLLVGCGNSGTSVTQENAGSESIETWDSTNDITIVSREDGSGTRGAFVELFEVEEKVNDKKVDMTTQAAQITNNTSVMLTTVAGDKYSIGYVSLGSLNDSVKVLSIDGVEATVENIENGSYKVCRPFNIAVKENVENKAVQDFMAYILSEEGQNIVVEAGYIPVQDVKKYESNGASGKVVVGGSSSVGPVMEKLIEAYKAVNPQVEIELQVTDSSTGISSTVDGSYDIGMASRDLKENEMSQGLQTVVMATDGIAVIVNQDNPIDNMSSEQVRTVYTGEALIWEEVME